ncbi:MAG: radical SAM family heme chaperone HemW, partial [Mobilitalea sp.]
ALLNEIESYQELARSYVVATIFIGGGTPSSLEVGQIKRILSKIHQVFYIKNEAEITIEVNPGTVNKEKLIEYQEAGINRISFGLQSANDKELKLLGRLHNYKQFEENYNLARSLGFCNINVDLMSALPGQTLNSWEETLTKVLSLKPDHISAYSLIVEEGTKFYERYQEGATGHKELPDEDTDRQMYHRTKQLLEDLGYFRYEISNYAKPGYECLHNKSYWIGTPYLGLGLGASSLFNGRRFTKLDELQEYMKVCQTSSDFVREGMIDVGPTKLIAEYEALTLSQRMEEFMYLGLRLCEGVKKSDFLHRFHVEMKAVYGTVMEQLKKQEVLIEEGDIVRLSEYGIDVSNSILYLFLLNDD